jgi:non-specific protein-tyrosine kinase
MFMTQLATPAAPGPAQPSFKAYAHLAWRWAWLFVLCALLGGAAAYLWSITLAPTFQASSKIIINEARTPAATNYNDILASERLARTYADLLKRESVLQAAFMRLGLDPALVEQEVTSVTVSPLRDTQLVALEIEGPQPQLVAAVANTLPEVLVEELRAIQAGRFSESKTNLTEQLDALKHQVETAELQLGALAPRRTAQEELAFTQMSTALTQYQTAYANLLQSYEALRLAEAQATDTIALIEPAAVPTMPEHPRVVVNTLLAAMLAALAAVGTALLIESLDDRIRTPEDLLRIAPIPVVGGISVTPATYTFSSSAPLLQTVARISPRPGRRASPVSAPPAPENSPSGSPEAIPATPSSALALISIRDPRHPIVEAYRRLRTNLQYANLDTGLGALMITSAEPGEGKSTTAANLAVVMAQAGARVILVDADLRKPRQDRLLGVLRQPGLAEALRGNMGAAGLLQPVAGVPHLQVLAAGEPVPNPAEVLGSQRMRQLAEQLRAQADIVIYDTPPLLPVTDAQVVGRLADAALLVIDSAKTAAGTVQRAVGALDQVHVPLAGALLNRLPSTRRGYGYGDYGDYGYYYAYDDKAA